MAVSWGLDIRSELQSPSVLLTLVYLQLLLERDDAEQLLASAKEEQWDHPEQKLH